MESHGVWTCQALIDCGVSDKVLASRVRSGRLERASRGVYVDPAERDRWTAVAVLLARCPEAAACGPTAAALFGWDGFDRPSTALLAEPTVVVPASRWLRVPGVRRSRHLEATDVIEVDGLRVTRPLRTLVDLVREADPDRVERALECALRRHQVSLEDVTGEAALEDLLARRGHHHPPTESDAETRFVQLVRRERGLDPARQVDVWDGDRLVGRADFVFRPQGVAVEIDGAQTHASARALQYDLNRQNRLVLAGVQPLRFTWQDIVHRPGVTLKVLDRALNA
jgi:very-short-patch-repair endonuclease